MAEGQKGEIICLVLSSDDVALEQRERFRSPEHASVTCRFCNLRQVWVELVSNRTNRMCSKP